MLKRKRVKSPELSPKQTAEEPFRRAPERMVDDRIREPREHREFRAERDEPYRRRRDDYSGSGSGTGYGYRDMRERDSRDSRDMRRPRDSYIYRDSNTSNRDSYRDRPPRRRESHFGDRDKKEIESDFCKVYIGHLTKDTTEQEVSEEFSKFGKIVSARMHEEYAFCEFERHEEAQSAIEGMHNTHWKGGRIIVEPSIKSRPKGPEKSDLCFKCNKPGHWASDCPINSDKDTKCFRCGKFGHKKTDCRTRMDERFYRDDFERRDFGAFRERDRGDFGRGAERGGDFGRDFDRRDRREFREYDRYDRRDPREMRDGRGDRRDERRDDRYRRDPYRNDRRKDSREFEGRRRDRYEPNADHRGYRDTRREDRYDRESPGNPRDSHKDSNDIADSREKNAYADRTRPDNEEPHSHDAHNRDQETNPIGNKNHRTPTLSPNMSVGRKYTNDMEETQHDIKTDL